MVRLTLPLLQPRPKWAPHRRRRPERAVPTNIRLKPSLKKRATEVAKYRYACSLTRLCSTLLEKEVTHKRGVVFAKLK